MNDAASLLGRILLAAIFIPAGYSKIMAYDGTAAFMATFNVPAFLLPAVIAVELLGGIAILIGFHARWAELRLRGLRLLPPQSFTTISPIRFKAPCS